MTHTGGRRRTIPLLLLFPSIHALWFCGMESALVIALLLAWARAAAQERSAAGAWAALLFLARLDTLVFITAPWLVWELWRHRHTRPFPVRHLAACILPVAAAFMAFTGYTWFTTGHLTPISGALKSPFPLPGLHPEFFLDPIHAAVQQGKWLSLILVPNLLNMSFLAIAGWVGWHRRRDFSALLLVVFTLSLLNLWMFQKWSKGIEFWYWAVPVGLLVAYLEPQGRLAAIRPAKPVAAVIRHWRMTAIKRFAERLFPPLSVNAKRRWRGGWGVRGFLLLLAAWHVRPFFQAPPPRYPDQTIAVVQRMLPAEAVLAATDAGDIACWSGRRTVNLDGLMNTYAYQDSLKAKRLASYLRAQGVTHLLGAACVTREREPMYHYRFCPEAVALLPQEGGGDGLKNTSFPSYTYHFCIYSYLHGAFSDTLLLTPAQEVWHSEPFTENGNTYRQFIWKLP